MKKLTIFSLLMTMPALIFARVEILDRVAIIVDDGLIMESQITESILEIKMNMQMQNITIPPREELREQVIERLIIEELQLQLGNLYGIRISDGELNQTLNTIAANNNLSLENFITTIEEAGQSYESVREKIRKDMIIQRVQRGKVGNEINITEQEFVSFLKTDASVAQIRPELLVRQILVNTKSKAESVLNWKPNSPIRLYHGTKDLNVLYENALVAKRKLEANGADKIQIIEPIKKTTISRLNKGKKWQYGYNEEHDVVVISRTGKIGEVYEIQNLKIALPKQKNIHSFEYNKWDKTEYPKSLSKIKTVFDWKQYPEDFKEKWYDYIDQEFTRREEGFWFYNKDEATYITGTHYMYLQWSKIDVGAPDFREANRLFFIFWEAVSYTHLTLPTILLV